MILSSSLALVRASIGQDPAAGVLALGLQADRARLLQQLERAVPEVQAQDVALVGEQVVADAEALHGGEVAVHDARGHVRGQRARCRCRPPRSRAASRPAASCARDRRRRSRRPARRGPSSSSRSLPGRGRATSASDLPLEVQEAHHDVGDLHAGVVDVVLHPDLAAAAPQHAHEGVAERRVAQVADVGGLVGVDARVLDDDRGPAAGAVRGAGQVRPGAPARTRRGPGTGSRSRRPPPPPARTPGTPPSSAASASAISRGLRRRGLARSKGAVKARSPSSGRGGILEGDARRLGAERGGRPRAGTRRGGPGGRGSWATGQRTDYTSARGSAPMGPPKAICYDRGMWSRSSPCRGAGRAAPPPALRGRPPRTPGRPRRQGTVVVTFMAADPDVKVNEEPAPRLKLDPAQKVLVDGSRPAKTAPPEPGGGQVPGHWRCRSRSRSPLADGAGGRAAVKGT